MRVEDLDNLRDNIVIIVAGSLLGVAHLVDLLDHDIQVFVDIVQLAVEALSQTVCLLSLLISSLHWLLQVGFVKDVLDLLFVVVKNQVQFLLLCVDVAQVLVDFTLSHFDLGHILVQGGNLAAVFNQLLVPLSNLAGLLVEIRCLLL